MGTGWVSVAMKGRRSSWAMQVAGFHCSADRFSSLVPTYVNHPD